MRIGIIGSGNMGRALGVRLARLGHPVRFGARRAEQAEAAAALAGPTGQAGTLDAAAAFGEVLVWTMREPNPAKVLAQPGRLVGKIVIDINNRDMHAVRDKLWFSEAIAEQLQHGAPEARVVKAFNTIAMESFDTDPAALRKAGAQTFLAGADAGAKEVVAGLALELGFASVDVGGVAAMRAVEALGDVIRLLMSDGGMGGQAHLRVDRLPAPKLGTIGVRAESDYG